MITDDYDYLAPGGRSFTLTSGRLARLNKNSRVLEIACGRGEAALALASTFNCKVEAFDIDPGMIDMCREKAIALNLADQVEFQVKDGKDMDFGSGHYDLILAEGGAFTYIGREDGVARCAELLKEGGYLALLDLIYLTEKVPVPVRKAYEEGVFTYLNEADYRDLLQRNSFFVEHASMVPPSGWDRYYRYMSRLVLGSKSPFPDEFKRSMEREIDVYYNKGGKESAGYLYAVSRLWKSRQLKPAPENLRVPVFGMMR